MAPAASLRSRSRWKTNGPRCRFPAADPDVYSHAKNWSPSHEITFEDSRAERQNIQAVRKCLISCPWNAAPLRDGAFSSFQHHWVLDQSDLWRNRCLACFSLCCGGTIRFQTRATRQQGYSQLTFFAAGHGKGRDQVRLFNHSRPAPARFVPRLLANVREGRVPALLVTRAMRQDRGRSHGESR